MIKTSGKEYFYMVSGLMPPKYMVSDTLTEDIEFFIDWVSKNSKSLEHLVEIDRVDMFTAAMEKLYVLLCSIHAHWLEMEAARIMRMVEINEKGLCLKLLVPFVANLHTLAIDIQMAQNKGFETSYRQRDEIERYRGVISNLRVVSTLLESLEYEKAFDLVVSMNEIQESQHSMPLVSSIISRRLEFAMELIERLTEQYKRKIDDVVTLSTEAIVQKKIMLVDDMADELSALSYMLKGNYQVFAFTSGKEALHFIDTKQPPDAFILDIDMPGMDGFALAKQIRERTDFKKTPILFLTGSSSKDTIIKSAMYGAKAFIVKPANKAIIISKLSSCLKA